MLCSAIALFRVDLWNLVSCLMTVGWLLYTTLQTEVKVLQKLPDSRVRQDHFYSHDCTRFITQKKMYHSFSVSRMITQTPQVEPWLVHMIMTGGQHNQYDISNLHFYPLIWEGFTKPFSLPSSTIFGPKVGVKLYHHTLVANEQDQALTFLEARNISRTTWWQSDPNFKLSFLIIRCVNHQSARLVHKSTVTWWWQKVQSSSKVSRTTSCLYMH